MEKNGKDAKSFRVEIFQVGILELQFTTNSVMTEFSL